jgi:hypothetical protein
VAPPVFKTRARGSPASCEVTLLAKSRCFHESRLRWMILEELGVATQWALDDIDRLLTTHIIEMTGEPARADDRSADNQSLMNGGHDAGGLSGFRYDSGVNLMRLPGKVSRDAGATIQVKKFARSFVP